VFFRTSGSKLNHIMIGVISILDAATNDHALIINILDLQSDAEQYTQCYASAAIAISVTGGGFTVSSSVSTIDSLVLG